MKRVQSQLTNTLGTPLANLSFATMKAQIRALQSIGISILHTARPFNFYRKVFYQAASRDSVLTSLQDKRVLDVGCGYTPYSSDSMFRVCHDADIEFYGIDPVLEKPPAFGWRERAFARALGSRGSFTHNPPGLDRALAARAQDLPFENASVDEILCGYLLFVWLENERDLADVFTEFNRVLKPGGVVKVYPFYQWKYVKFEHPSLLQSLANYNVSQHLVHGGLDFRIGPSLMTKFQKV